jgi:hypothetical protein
LDAKQALKIGIDMGDQLIGMYLGDLTDADLLVRPVPGANHIAWQLGHLIEGENGIIGAVCPGAMPPLSDGFKGKYTKETAASDDPKAFLTKAEYLKAYKQQHEAVLAALAKVDPAELDKPAPESIRSYAPTVAAAFSLIGSHAVMHAAQWAVIRRKLGKPPIF